MERDGNKLHYEFFIFAKVNSIVYRKMFSGF